MTISMAGEVIRLKGDLTSIGLTSCSINSMSGSLNQIESGQNKEIRVDCGEIRSADTMGLQLFYVWVQCAKLRGGELVLLNLPERLKRTMQELGFWHCFSGIHTDT